MSMNYKEVPQKILTEEATRYARGIKSMSDLADSLRRQGELPERFSKPEADITQVEPDIEQAASVIPDFYIKRPVEGLVLPSPDRLVVSAKTELKAYFGIDFEVPVPPQDLFETLQNFAERDIRGLDEVYYQPGLLLTKDDKFWKPKGIVKPESYFWQNIENGNFPQETAMLEEGWFIGDSRVKPMYDCGQQRYGKDDYLEPLMAYLRGSNRIKKYSRVPDRSRAVVSPREIEEIILPKFAVLSGTKGTVRNRRYMEFNVRGNIAHREYGQTNTWEWFGDSVFPVARRLIGGSSVHGGLAFVHDHFVPYLIGITGFSPVVAFPSKP